MRRKVGTKRTKATKHTKLLFLKGVVPFVIPFVAFVVSLSAQPPQRIVSLVPAVTEMLFAIGAGSQVVAVSSYDQDPPEVNALPRVGALLDPDVERILSLRPDLVITYGSQTDLQSQLERARIVVFDYRHAGLAAITATMRALGAGTGHAPEAEAAARGIESRLPPSALGPQAGRGHARCSSSAVSGGTAQHLRERRTGIPSRHARSRRRCERVCGRGS
jgi:ABC-type hemin transport system substrate-binding protein